MSKSIYIEYDIKCGCDGGYVESDRGDGHYDRDLCECVLGREKQRRNAFWRAAFIAAIPAGVDPEEIDWAIEVAKKLADAALALAIEERKV